MLTKGQAMGEIYRLYKLAVHGTCGDDAEVAAQELSVIKKRAIDLLTDDENNVIDEEPFHTFIAKRIQLLTKNIEAYIDLLLVLESSFEDMRQAMKPALMNHYFPVGKTITLEYLYNCYLGLQNELSRKCYDKVTEEEQYTKRITDALAQFLKPSEMESKRKEIDAKFAEYKTKNEIKGRVVSIDDIRRWNKSNNCLLRDLEFQAEMGAEKEAKVEPAAAPSSPTCRSPGLSTGLSAASTDRPDKPQDLGDNNNRQQGDRLTLGIQKFELVDLIAKLLQGKILDPKKRGYFADLKLKIENSDFTDPADLKNAAKNVIMLSLQRTCFGFTNTTNSGLKIRRLLNEDGQYIHLKKLLFGLSHPLKTQQPPVTYRALRKLIVGDNLPKVFSSCNKGRMFTLFENIKTKTNTLVSNQEIRETLMPKRG